MYTSIPENTNGYTDRAFDDIALDKKDSLLYAKRFPRLESNNKQA